MPYRYFLIPTIFITLLYFGITYLYTEPNPIIIIILIGLCAAIMSFQNIINDWWFSKFNPKLERQEIMWLEQFVPFIRDLPNDDKNEFFQELAKMLEKHEFIKMGLEKLPEELKWMALSPAVRLKIYNHPKLYDEYIRTVFYPHPFITPNQDWIHISETYEEDSVMIYSAEHLQAAYANSKLYFNPALYEWSKVFVNILKIDIDIDINQCELLLNKLHETTIEKTLHWLGAKSIHFPSIAIYALLMDPVSTLKLFPELANLTKLYNL